MHSKKLETLLKSLLKTRSSDLNSISDVFWQRVSELTSMLKSAYEATINMQKVGYGMSDLFISWLRIGKNLERLQNQENYFNLATKLREKMDEREPSLFRNSLMVCSIYLDPRIMFKLNSSQKSLATASLMKVFDRISEMKQTEHRNDVANDTLDEIQGEFLSRIDEFPNNSRIPLMQQFEMYERVRASDIRAPVMTFWQANKDTYPLLYQLAEVLHAVPSNQCGTERSFSSFSYVRSSHRMSMSPKNLSNLLMIRLNKDIFQQQKEIQINKILDSKN